MEISMVIVSLILVGIVFIPFYLFNAAGISEKKIRRKKIEQLIIKNGLNINESETWGISYIGLDTTQKKLLFLKIDQTEERIQLLDIELVKEVETVEKRKAIKRADRSEQLLERLYLQVLLKNGKVCILNFYDSAENQSEDFEVLRIKKWETLINKYISSSLLRKKSA